MAKNIQSIRGMHDILPSQSASWQHLETTVRALFNSYGYRELRTPLIEPTELFSRGIGEVTDIVEKEMYTFEDRSACAYLLSVFESLLLIFSAAPSVLITVHYQLNRLYYHAPADQ